MTDCQKHRISGFTLLEMLLVLAISSSLLLLLMNFNTQKMEQTRRDKTVLQIEQIMNAAMSYYLNNSAWPLACNGSSWTALSSVTTNNFNTNYISGISNNAFGLPYYVYCTTQTTTSGGNFYVGTTVNTNSGDALVIAGALPMAFITTAATLTSSSTSQTSGCNTAPYTGCQTVVSSVNVPGQNINNARSLNFAGIYYSGSCVPAPSCPAGMSPAIIVAPAGATGINDSPTCTGTDPMDASTCSAANIYPISSFSAFARGDDANGTPGAPNGSGTASQTSAPFNCDPTLTLSSAPLSAHQTCWASDSLSGGRAVAMSGSPAATTYYWRVCLLVITEKGQVNPTSSTARWTEMGKIMGQIAAFTRCVPNAGAEVPSGSSNVYQYYQ